MLKRAIAGPVAVPIDDAIHDIGAGSHRLDGICQRKPEIVMAMNFELHVGTDNLAMPPHDITHGLRRAIAAIVENANPVRTRFDVCIKRLLKDFWNHRSPGDGDEFALLFSSINGGLHGIEHRG